MKLNISVFGLGYVGTVLLGCLAKDGHKVLGVDVDPIKLDLLRNGKAPVLEEGIQALIQSSIESGRVDVTNDTEFAINNTDLSFVCVGTPAMANGSQDLRAILRLAEEIGKALKNKPGFHTIVIRSTVLPGTVENKIEPVIEQFSEKKSG
ncbi:MAG: UDP-glucose/GDP-mannose dehydrogenase family protein, partial [Desulfatiglans sp.]|nr:UDP-glucose/GDP-mannose dehydrogenase family protein [Desulfatiglans sp.]